ncbi:MAG: carboxypeptidase regulatory-like domain-containing protein [Chloracidobacterium sp.]|nr:carboxypeptidase regulatory-like domain-containing protein [Chloracidobacterium sp.]
MGFSLTTRRLWHAAFMVIALSAVPCFAAPTADVEVVIENTGNLGIIKGRVLDEAGGPIADASVAIFRSGTSKLLKQVSSARDGSFLARIMPGTYTVLAVAQGFNPMTLFGVEVARAAELTYGFKLERAGSGNTLPERRPDKNSSKWRIRAAQTQRSIYQNREGQPLPADETASSDTDVPEGRRKGQTVIGTYAASGARGNYAGVNFATALPLDHGTDVVVAGQFGKGTSAPARLETFVKLDQFDGHTIRLNSAVSRLGVLASAGEDKALGQFSFQAVDEWQVRDGVVLVLGFDYARFLGAGSDAMIAPRLGLQVDLNSRTRLRSAFVPQTEQRSWSDAIDLEGQSIAFAEPVAVEDLFLVSNKPQINKSRRLEFGIERVIDGRSSVEANVFFDTVFSRGVGLVSLGRDDFGDLLHNDLVAHQQGNARGLRVVYSRRIGTFLSASAGYSAGQGQRLSDAAITDPASTFENDFFQSLYGQITADLGSGTNVRTVYRLSPQATVFAIDPFKGRLAVFDPGLSVYVTQTLPTFGLPFRAEAMVDARNLFDIQSGVTGEENSLRLNGQRRMVRGGIQVRF